jgi:hypothetical protein
MNKPHTQSEVETEDARFWLAEIDAAKDRVSDWYEKAEEAEEKYKDDRERAFGAVNLFWSNVETQKAAIGEDFGKPQVTRVNMPENDGGLARQVSMVWERSIAAAVRDTNDNHDIGLAVNDIFIPGRGQIWLELEVKEEPGRPKWVCAPLVRVKWCDYLEGPADRWGDVPWVARRHEFTRDELMEECGLDDDEAAAVPLNTRVSGDRKKRRRKKGDEQFMRAAVWEIWTKFPRKGRLYVAEGYDEVLCWDDDPYRLKNFFPCPRPIRANGDEGMEPITDFSRCEDQFLELNRISERIYVLTETLRRRGVHDKRFKEMGDLALADDNVSLAIESWEELKQAGGLPGVMLWEDLQPTIQVLMELHKQRRELVNLIYELSGVSDLARGMTDPRETLGAQKLKASFGSGRFRSREVESRRFAAEAYALKAEIIAEMFPREQIQEMSGISLPTRADVEKANSQLKQIVGQYQAAQQAGIQLPPPNQEQIDHLARLAQTRFTWEDVSGVLRSDYRRCYTVECETDQTKFIDEESDKQAVTQMFGQAITALQQLAPMIAGNPKTGDVFKQLFMFVISRFRAGRAMEEGFERVFDDAISAAQGQQGQQQPPSPEVLAGQAKVKVAEIGLQTAQVRLQTEQIKAQNAGVKVKEQVATTQIKAIEGQQKVQAQRDMNEAKRTGQQIENLGKAEELAFEAETRATAEQALLLGPTRAPARNGAAA